MKIEGNKLQFFKELLAGWRDKNDSETELLEQHTKQYEGDPSIDGSDVPATVVRNITYELIEAQVSTDIPAPRVSPCRRSDKGDRCARSVECLLSSVRDTLPFERMNDIEERLTPVHGGAARVIDWDAGYLTHDTVGRADVTVTDMLHIVWQPGVFEIKDMDAVFVLYDTTKSAIADRYGVEYYVADETERDAADEDNGEETVTVYVCWYRNGSGQVCKYVFSGDVELEDIDNYWARKRRVCSVCGTREELSESGDGEPGVCRCGGKIIDADEEYEELTHDITGEDGNVIIPAMSPRMEHGRVVTETVELPLTDEAGLPVVSMSPEGVQLPLTQTVERPVMVPTRIKWYRPDIYPVIIRKNTSRNRSLLGQSDCRFIRPQQQAINKLESRILAKSMETGSFPVKPTESQFLFDNSIGQRVLTLGPGEHKSDYGVITTQCDISSDTAAADRIYEHAKRLIGISDTYMGQADSTAKSGVAKQVQVQQSSGRLASKRTMKQAAYAECDEALFKLYLAYADEPRPAAYTDEFGAVQYISFNRYDFVEYDESTGEYYYDDNYRFSCDLTGGLEDQYEQRWQLIASDYTAGMYGDPAATVTKLAVWLAREKARYPGAHTQVEFFRRLLDAEKQLAESAGTGMQSGMLLERSTPEPPQELSGQG